MEALKTEQRGGGRCKACDKVFSSSEIYWRKKLKLWEDLCPSCRSIVLQDLLQLEEEPLVKSQTFYQKYNHLFPSEPGTIHTHHCKEGVRNDSFYITRNQDMSVVAFCHHCQESGYWQDTLEKF